jgi:hypothetical protein
MRVSSRLLLSPTMAIAFTAVTIAIMLLAANIIIANAQQQPPQPQQQLQSSSDDGGLTATINSDSFTTGETITISGSVAQRGSSSNVVIEITDPQGQLVKRGFPSLSVADNTFTYTFVAGEQEQFDTNAPMIASGNYLVKVRYYPPSDGIVIEEVELSFRYNSGIVNTPAGAAEPEARTTPSTTTSSQQTPTQNVTTTTAQSSAATTVRSTTDSFRVQVPQGWAIHDVKNTGFTLAAEVLKGFGLLAQLCPDEEQQQQIALVNAGTNRSNSSGSNSNSCHGAQEEVIHIIRYPNLGARLGIPSDEDAFTFINGRDTIHNAILSYHMQKLGEVGYQDLRIVASTDTTINVDNGTTRLSNNRIATTIPAKFVEITYSTNFEQNETKRGYFILTATATTPRNLGVMTGYSIFYEGNFTTAEETIIASGNLAPTSRSLPPPVRQVFDSFELVAASTEPLRVEIISEDTEGVAPATFEFEANVTGGAGPFTYSWDFGDGSIEIDVDDGTIEHTFDIAGTYNVDLTVTDSTGRSVSDSILITFE